MLSESRKKYVRACWFMRIGKYPVHEYELELERSIAYEDAVRSVRNRYTKYAYQ